MPDEEERQVPIWLSSDWLFVIPSEVSRLRFRRPAKSRNLSSIRLLSRFRLCGASHDAEADVRRVGSVRRARVGGLVRAASDCFALAVWQQNPFGNIAAKIEDQL